MNLFSGQDEVRTSNLLHLSWDFLHSDLMLQQLSHLSDWKFSNFQLYNTFLIHHMIIYFILFYFESAFVFRNKQTSAKMRRAPMSEVCLQEEYGQRWEVWAKFDSR